MNANGCSNAVWQWSHIYISLTLMIFYDRSLRSKLKWLEFSWQVHGNATIWIPQAIITGIMISSIIRTYFLYKLLDKCRQKNNCCTLKTSQTKLHCPGWIWPLHRCKVVHALENTTKPNDVMNMENRNLCFTYATWSFPCKASQSYTWKPWRFFRPRVSNTPSISVGTKDSSPAKQCEENSSPSLRILLNKCHPNELTLKRSENKTTNIIQNHKYFISYSNIEAVQGASKLAFAAHCEKLLRQWKPMGCHISPASSRCWQLLRLDFVNREMLGLFSQVTSGSAKQQKLSLPLIFFPWQCVVFRSCLQAIHSTGNCIWPFVSLI